MRKGAIHFIGIGGVGMSGIARVAHDQGYQVSGSDVKPSRYTDQLQAAGLAVRIGQDAENIPAGSPIVVVSSAVPETNPELAAARARGLQVWQRAQMLAALGEGKKTLAVAGTHGKTTASSMLATVIDELGMAPTYVVGGTLNAYGTNADSGAGPYYVVEADESDGSLIHIRPHIALITNIEADHLDHYEGGIDEIRATFARFMASVPSEGAVVVCGEDAALVKLAQQSGRRVITYGFSSSCDVYISAYSTEGVSTTFTVKFGDGHWAVCRLPKSPGRHNALNAAGVLAVAREAGETISDAARALSRYKGVARRFDLLGDSNCITVADDYAHHPTEIKATIAAARELDFEKLVVVFQPHRYSRVQSMLDDFACAFDQADHVVVCDIYAAGETPIPGITGKTVADAVSARATVGTTYAPTKDEAVAAAVEVAREGDLIFTMGAGDVTSYGPEILSALSARWGA